MASQMIHVHQDSFVLMWVAVGRIVVMEFHAKYTTAGSRLLSLMIPFSMAKIFPI